MASGVSGKSLGSYAGLAIVFLNEECQHRLSGKVLCPSFDLLRILEAYGPVSTIPSPLLLALRCALEDSYSSPEAILHRYLEYKSLGQQARHAMRGMGLEPLVPDNIAAPNITTFRLPAPSFARECLQRGYEIAHESNYLQARGWGQIATMGSVTPAMLECFFRR